MVQKTRHPNIDHRHKQDVLVVTDNGLPVSGLVEIQGTNRLIYDTTTSLVYAKPTVTIPIHYDLGEVVRSKKKYTGQLVLETKSKEIYYIDKASINYTSNSFSIYQDPQYTLEVDTIDISAGWVIAEAKLVNHLSTSSATHIDKVTFRGFDVNFRLDGSEDSIRIVDAEGHELDINPDGTLDVNVNINAEDGDTIAISRHANPFDRYTEQTYLKAHFDADYKDIYSYTAIAAGTRVKQIKVVPPTYGSIKVLVNGTLVDMRRNSFGERDFIINFPEEIELGIGDILKIQVNLERLRIDEYAFGFKLDGYFNN